MSPKYDVFLSFKNLGPDGAPTLDSALARNLYDALTGQGLAVFFSNISLERLGVAAYKKAIDDALESAQVLIAVGTSAQNLESTWVRYEWDGFINDVLSGLKKNGRVFAYVDNVSTSALPRALRQYTVVTHGPKSLELLTNYVLNGLETKRGAPVVEAVSEKPAEAPPIPSPPGETAILDCTGPTGASALLVHAAQTLCAVKLGLPVRRSIDLGPGFKLDMVLIPPGRFMMGSPDSEAGRNSDETLHEVELTRPFYLGIHPVTRGQFAEFYRESAESRADLEGGAYVFTANSEAYGWMGKIFSRWELDPGATWRRPGFEQAPDHPVVCVSCNDADKFMAWLKTKQPGDYCLPTEAQWEYACRAGTRTAYHFGNELSPKFANFAEAVGRTTPVGAYKTTNAFGLFDMHGNVHEWCRDFYDAALVDRGKVDPTCPAGSVRVYRGGTWLSAACYSRSASRKYPHLPAPATPTFRSFYHGFRLALLA